MPQDPLNDISYSRAILPEISFNKPELQPEAKVHFFAAEPPRLPKRDETQGAPDASAVDATRQSRLFSDTHLAFSFTRPIIYRPHEMAEPKKQEKDYTKEVDALLPETKSLAEVRGDDPE